MSMSIFPPQSSGPIIGRWGWAKLSQLDFRFSDPAPEPCPVLDQAGPPETVALPVPHFAFPPARLALSTTLDNPQANRQLLFLSFHNGQGHRAGHKQLRRCRF